MIPPSDFRFARFLLVMGASVSLAAWLDLFPVPSWLIPLALFAAVLGGSALAIRYLLDGTDLSQLTLLHSVRAGTRACARWIKTLTTRTLRRWATAPVIWGATLPLAVRADLQEQFRFFRHYPKWVLPLRLTNAAVLTFGILLAVCWLISMLSVSMVVAFDAATGNLNWSFYGGPLFGITFGFSVWIALCVGVSFLLGWIEKRLISGKWVPPRP